MVRGREPCAEDGTGEAQSQDKRDLEEALYTEVRLDPRFTLRELFL